MTQAQVIELKRAPEPVNGTLVHAVTTQPFTITPAELAPHGVTQHRPLRDIPTPPPIERATAAIADVARIGAAHSVTTGVAFVAG